MCFLAKSTISCPVMDVSIAVVIMSLVGHGSSQMPRSHSRVIRVLIRVNPWPRILEFPRVLLGPAFNHNLFVGIELDGIATLPVQIAEEAVFPSAEWKIGHGRGNSDVNPDIARGRFVAKAARGRSAGSEQRSLVAVGAVFEKGQSFVHIFGVNEAENGAENLCVSEIAGCGNVVENSRLHEVSRFVFRDLRIAAVEQNFCTLLLAEADQRLHAFFALRRDDGPHLHICVESVTDFQFRSSLGNRVAKRLLRLANGDRDRDSKTALSRAAEGAVADDL